MKAYAAAPYGDISGVQSCRYSENISSQVISCMTFPDDLMMCKAVCVCACGGVIALLQKCAEWQGETFRYQGPERTQHGNSEETIHAAYPAGVMEMLNE